MKTKREYNYDLLRVISMMAVIMIHVSATWLSGFSEYVAKGGNVKELISPIMSCIYNSISRFAVPCFIMLSGAFILDDDRNANYQEFYLKKLRKLGVTTFIFSAFYILYRIPFCFLGERTGISKVISLLISIATGSPFYHMWYLYMMIGVYLLAPIVIRFKNSISYKNFRTIVFLFLLLANISRWTTTNVRLNWDLGQSFEYLGYFMVGYVLRKDLHKNNRKGILCIGLGVLVEIVTAMIQYKFQILDGIVEADLKFRIVSPYSPIIVLASVLIFSGFTMIQLNYNKWIEKVAELSFVIYLFHAGVWDFFVKFIYLIKGKDYVSYILNLNNMYWIPLFTVIVFLVSLFLTILYHKVELFVKERNKKNSVE